MSKDIFKAKIGLFNKMFKSSIKESNILIKIIIKLSLLPIMFNKICKMQYEDVENNIKKFMYPSYVLNRNGKTYIISIKYKIADR
jgi:hypothetical protein